MRKARLLAVATVIGAVAAAPGLAAAMETNSPSPPANPSSGTTTTKQKPKKEKHSAAEEFLNNWRKAYALVYDKQDYTGGIAALHAMDYDNNADVATLIGYASRKLGRYDDAKYWYEKALAADPKHALTWSYYGMWQAEQGNVIKAKEDLEQVRLICGTECREYVALKDVIDGTRTY
jgi:tetratricopeptide (TPR) repeat protein